MLLKQVLESPQLSARPADISQYGTVREVIFMTPSTHAPRARWRDYVASAYLRRITDDTRDYDPGKGGRIYRRYDYTIEAVGALAETRRRANR